MPCTVPVGNPPQPCGNSTSEMFPNHCPLHVDLADDPWPDELPESIEDLGVSPAGKSQAERIAYAQRVLAATPMFGSPKLTPKPTPAPTCSPPPTNARHSPTADANPPVASAGQSESRTVGKSPCGATTRAGAPCRFSARKESGLCVNHDPAYKEQQRDNTRKGGQRSAEARFDPNMAEALPLRELNFATRADIQATIALVTRLELFGRLSPVRSRNLLRALSIAARNINGMGSNGYHAYPGSASYLEQYLPELLNVPNEPPPAESTHEKP